MDRPVVSTFQIAEGQFECRNQECIQSELLCDGTVDCSDSSDETENECLRPELECPTYTFRCTYGACIDRGVLCDGTNDCSVDGSDEDPLGICRQGSSGGAFAGYAPTEPVPVNRNQPCRVPFPPINGNFQLRRISDNDDFEYVDPLDQNLPIDSLLVYTCATGYKIRGSSNIRCLQSGKWTRKPVCIEIKCPPIGSLSIMGNCTHASGRVRPCSDTDPVRPQTRAQISCRPGYRKDTEISISGSETVECNGDGKWGPNPIRCVPVCGIANPLQQSLGTGGTAANIGTFPWHATLYVQRNSSNGTEKVFRCGATVIEANLLLTAAHCLYDSDTSSDSASISRIKILEFLQNFFVVTGNTHLDYDSPLHNSQFVRRHRLRNVHTDCNFRTTLPGQYFGDIALLELEEPFEFTSALLPACLDKTAFTGQILEAGVNGRVTASGRSSTNQSSRMLQTTRVPYVPNSQCTTLQNTTPSLAQINIDKFCTGYNSGTDPCLEDLINDGGGLVHEINDLWYLTGIVNQAINVGADGGQRSCDRNSQLVHTNVSQHMAWIQRVISDLERFKPPFRLRIIAPTPESTSTTTTTTPTTMTPIITSPIPEIITRSSMEIRNPVIVPDDEDFSVAVSSCVIPEQPANGTWRLHRDFCPGDVHCQVPESSLIMITRLRQGSQLVFRCASGYRIKGNSDVYCRADREWSSIPICTEIRCSTLNTVSTITTCSRFGESVNCDFPVLPNTQAKVSCRSGYWARPTESDIVECNMNGMWEPHLSTCVPVCGSTFSPPTIFGGSENTAGLYKFPWHATLYVQRNSSRSVTKDVQCGAALIQANLLLTAAHCVYDDRTRTTEDPSKLFILMNNIHRRYASLLHDFHFVRRGTVKNVHVHCKYRGLEGNYVADIALLELQEPFEFFSVQLHPACLDFSGYKGHLLGPGASGAVIGFGKTTTGVLSDILQTITVPYVSQAQCMSSNITAEKKVFINSDKFCAGYNNGTAVCLGKGGGALSIEVNGLWYIAGIASIDLSVNANNGENSCDGDAYTLYTNVSDYMAWILDVMFHLERYKKYPPCSRIPIPWSENLKN